MVTQHSALVLSLLLPLALAWPAARATPALQNPFTISATYDVPAGSPAATDVCFTTGSPFSFNTFNTASLDLAYTGPLGGSPIEIEATVQGSADSTQHPNQVCFYFGSTPVSADYFGLFCDLIEKHLGGGMCAMSQGTSGDLMWMDYGAEKKDLTLQSYTEGVVSYAKKALAQVKYQDHAELGMIEKQLTLKYRTPDKERLSWAERINAQIQNDLPKDKTEVYAREAVILDPGFLQCATRCARRAKSSSASCCVIFARRAA